MEIDLKGYPHPNTSEQEVLLSLILDGSVSIIEYGWLPGFRTRISQLQTKRGLFLERIFLFRRNKFGNVFKYARHTLPESEKDKAINIYYQLNNQKK